jgi:hypothetical protein
MVCRVKIQVAKPTVPVYDRVVALSSTLAHSSASSPAFASTRGAMPAQAVPSHGIQRSFCLAKPSAQDSQRGPARPGAQHPEPPPVEQRLVSFGGEQWSPKHA